MRLADFVGCADDVAMVTSRMLCLPSANWIRWLTCRITSGLP